MREGLSAAPTTQRVCAYLYDMLEAARLVHGYVAGVSFEEFWRNSEKRDAVTLRMSVLGESAHKIDTATEAVLSGVPFKGIRAMRNRIAHDYGPVDCKIVWAVTQEEIEPLIAALEAYFKQRPFRSRQITCELPDSRPFGVHLTGYSSGQKKMNFCLSVGITLAPMGGFDMAQTWCA